MNTPNIGLLVDLELTANASDPCGPRLQEGETIVTANVFTVPDPFIPGSGSFGSNGAYLRYVPVDIFNGTGYFLQHSDDALFRIDPTGWAGMAELNFRTKQPSMGHGQTIANKGTIAGDDEWALIYVPTLDKMLFFLVTEDGEFDVFADMPADPTLTRHFAFFGIDPGTKKAWIQIDNGTPVSVTYTGTPVALGNAPIWFGAYRGGGAGQPDYIATTGNDFDIRHLRLWSGSCISFSLMDKSTLYNSGSGITLAAIELIGPRVRCNSSPICTTTMSNIQYFTVVDTPTDIDSSVPTAQFISRPLAPIGQRSVIVKRPGLLSVYGTTSLPVGSKLGTVKWFVDGIQIPPTQGIFLVTSKRRGCLFEITAPGVDGEMCWFQFDFEVNDLKLGPMIWEWSVAG